MLSNVIEYLLSLERPGGGRLVYAGGSQFIVPAFPPNTAITLTTAPFGNDYAYIPYYAAIGPAVVPGAFWGWGQHFGNRLYTGVIASWFMQNALDSFVFVTESEPAIAQLTNQTALNQYYEGISFFVAIASEDDYHRVLEALARLGTSARTEQLAIEANRLLRKLAGEPPVPEPPIGGG